ncbi:MAG: hypothetical protein GY896_24425 [Gammaproteobacteria bacterium]|nr:hypothetical protein [Gammaproteobacteria bacterium]MCP4978946.1 hypothetical protein [Gammaproteobacteria bacterium]
MKRFDQINVIPFIDIMMVLLAIVLTTATFISQGRLDIDVPKASSKQSPHDTRQTLHLAIDRHEIIFYQDTPVTLQTLETRVSRIDGDTRIVLSVEQTVPFQRFVHVIDLLKRQHIERLSIVTRQIK